MKKRRRFEVGMTLPAALLPGEAEVLCQKMLSGDDGARERLILGCLRLVAAKVGEVLKKQSRGLCGLEGDDLFAVGAARLVQAVEAMTDARNPIAYLSKSIAGAISNELKNNRQCAVVPLSDLSLDVVDDRLTASEIDEAIEAASENAIDRQILRLRQEGFILKDIAAAVGRPLSSVCDRLKYLMQEIQAKLAASPRKMGTKTVSIEVEENDGQFDNCVELF